MALTATMHQVKVALSDVDRGVYETLELRIARHPSETLRYMLTRILAYALEYEEGIAFSKAGLSDTEEPPISITDLTGVRLAWIEVGSPSADRLHKASKATRRVAIYTSTDLGILRREAASRPIHRLDEIAVWHFDTAFLTGLEDAVDRKMDFDVMRTGGQLYVTARGKTHEATLEQCSLQTPV